MLRLAAMNNHSHREHTLARASFPLGIVVGNPGHHEYFGFQVVEVCACYCERKCIDQEGPEDRLRQECGRLWQDRQP